LPVSRPPVKGNSGGDCSLESRVWSLEQKQKKKESPSPELSTFVFAPDSRLRTQDRLYG
jgi:hypothetical protein